MFAAVYQDVANSTDGLVINQSCKQTGLMEYGNPVAISARNEYAVSARLIETFKSVMTEINCLVDLNHFSISLRKKKLNLV